MWLVCHTIDNEIRTPHFERSYENALRFIDGTISDLISVGDGAKYKLDTHRKSGEVVLTTDEHTFMWRIFQCSMEVV